MFRLACGLAITAYIFVHSPERPATPVSQDAAGWYERTREEITRAALNAEATRNVLAHTLRSDEAKTSR